MFVTLAAAVLAAGVDVYSVVSAPGAEKTLLERLDGKPINATQIFRPLFEPSGILPINDFEIFKERSPPGWPEALQATWTRGLAHCATLAGPVPWKPTGTSFGTARCCGIRLGSFLWKSYLENVGAKRVVDVSQSPEPGCRVTVNVFDLKGRTFVRQQRPCAEQTAAIDDALAGKGTRSAWEVYDSIGEPTAKDVFAGKTGSVEAVPLEATCHSQPPALQVEGSSVLATALVKRWATSVPTRGPPLVCTLEQFEHKEPASDEAVLPMPMHVVSAILKCGNTTVAAEAAKEVGPGVDLLSKRLVTSLAASVCH